jgi:hypothetical protein
VAPVLHRCDAEGTPAAAAVHTWANVRWLRRLGFAVVESTETTDDALPLYVLVRDPGGSPVEDGDGRSYPG